MAARGIKREGGLKGTAVEAWWNEGRDRGGKEELDDRVDPVFRDQ